MSINTFLDGLNLLQLQPRPLNAIVDNIPKQITIDELLTLSNQWFGNARLQPDYNQIKTLQQKMIEHLNMFLPYQSNQEWSHESRRV